MIIKKMNFRKPTQEAPKVKMGSGESTERKERTLKKLGYVKRKGK